MTRVEVIGDATPWVRIYALFETGSGRVRYVGKTSRYLHQRHKQHIAEAVRRPRLPVGRWLRKQIEDGARLGIQLLENVQGADWQSREQFWIAKFRAEGADLLNLTDGGEGCHGLKVSAERRAAVSAALRRGADFLCETCNTQFWRKPKDIKAGDCRFCSRECYHVATRGPLPKAWERATALGIVAAAEARRSRTHCKRNHPLSGDNLYVNTKGARVCKACRTMHKTAYRARGGRG